MKTPKKPAAKVNGKMPSRAINNGTPPESIKPAKKFDDEDDEFEEPLEDVDFESLNNLDDDDF